MIFQSHVRVHVDLHLVVTANTFTANFAHYWSALRSRTPHSPPLSGPGVLRTGCLRCTGVIVHTVRPVVEEYASRLKERITVIARYTLELYRIII